MVAHQAGLHACVNCLLIFGRNELVLEEGQQRRIPVNLRLKTNNIKEIFAALQGLFQGEIGSQSQQSKQAVLVQYQRKGIETPQCLRRLKQRHACQSFPGS